MLQVQNYGYLAFEILEQTLREELSNSKKDKDNFNIINIGYSLMKFIENGFFESKNPNKILQLIDKYAFKETERLSRTHYNQSHTMKLILLGNYFLDREQHIKENEFYFLKIRQHLQIIFFELKYNIHSILRSDYNTIFQFKRLINTSFSNPSLKHFTKNTQSIELKLFNSKFSFEKFLSYNNLITETITNKNITIIQGLLYNVTKLFEEFKNMNNISYDEKMLKLMIYGNLIVSDKKASSQGLISLFVNHVVKRSRI